MPMIQLSLKHGQTADEARRRLEQTVGEARAQFGRMIQRTDWSPGRDSVHLAGRGFAIDLRVDPTDLHVSGDVPFIGLLLNSRILSGLKQIIQDKFQKQLP